MNYLELIRQKQNAVTDILLLQQVCLKKLELKDFAELADKLSEIDNTEIK